MHFFVDFLRSRIPGTWRPSSSGWLSGNCPVCVQNGESRPDTKRRGGFQIKDDEWVYHCFNCGMKTGWSKGHRLNSRIKLLLKGFGVSESELQRVTVELMREAETAELLNPVLPPPPAFIPNWPEVSLPNDTTPLADLPEAKAALDAVTVLHQRGLLHWTDWFYGSTDWKYRRRVILPYRYKGVIVGHTARVVGPVKGQIPKYLVHKPEGYVFNLDRQTAERQLVIVTEGDFDAVTVDGVSLGSNSVSTQQASLITQLRRRPVLLPDADAAGQQLIEPAIDLGWSVSFPEWMESHKDANSAAQEWGRLAVIKSVIQSATDNPSKIRVLARRYMRD